MINTSTADLVTIRMGEYRDADTKFWHLAAHYDSNSNEMKEATKVMKGAANRLMQSLLELVFLEE